MRIAALLFTVAFALTAGLPSAQAQAPTGTISGRILVDGVADKTSPWAILVLPADIRQPVNILHHIPDFMSVGSEFTVTGLDDQEYLVVLIDRLPAEPEETVEFWREGLGKDGLPRRWTWAAVRVTVENGQPDREVVFELPDIYGRSGAPADYPSTGVASPTAGRLPTHLAPAVAGLGVLLFAAGAFALRLQGRESDD